MEKKNESKKKITQSDLKKIMALGNIAEKSYKKEAIEKIQNQEVASIQLEKPETEVEVLPSVQAETLPAVEATQVNVTIEPEEHKAPEKNTPPEPPKPKEEALTMPNDIPFEDFLKKYIPADLDKRESTYIYTTNLRILKAIATSEGSAIVDLLNNIVATWAAKYNKNIRKSLQKPSKLVGF